jgi:glycosyl transferase family 25
MGAPFRALAQDDMVAAAEGALGAMIPVYVINLARSPERRAFMREELAKAGVSADFVMAVDGRACRARAALHLSVAETALILSHRKAWRRLLKSGAPFGVVLEDDVHLGENFATLLGADWGAHIFDAVKLETMFDRVWIARRGEAVVGRTLRRLGAEHLGAAGYLISRAGARKCLAMTRGLTEPVDQTLFGRTTIFEGRLRVLQLAPGAVVQDRPHHASGARPPASHRGRPRRPRARLPAMGPRGGESAGAGPPRRAALAVDAPRARAVAIGRPQPRYARR